jgi:hypothetical protein
MDGKGLGGKMTSSEALSIVSAIYALSFVAALLMMGLGFFWLIIAILTSIDLAFQGGFPFNMYDCLPTYVVVSQEH